MPFSASIDEVRRGMDEMNRISGKKGLKDHFRLYVDLPHALKPGKLQKVDEDFEETLTCEIRLRFQEESRSISCWECNEYHN